MSDRVESALQVGNGLLVRAAAQSLGSGALVVRDRARQLVAALEVLRQLGGDGVQAAGPCGFQSAADPRMTEPAACRRQSVVEELTVEVVAESVMFTGRPIRPRARTGLDDEHAVPSQACAGDFYRLDL